MKQIWAVGLGILCACGADPVVELGSVPGTAVVSWETAREGEATVVYQVQGQDSAWSTPAGPATTGHEVPVYGLKVGQTYTAHVDVTANGRTQTSSEVTFTVDPPPAGTPALTQKVWNPDAACTPGGFVLFSHLSQRGSGVGIVDRDGSYVWAHNNDIEGAAIGRPRPGRDGGSILWNTADEARTVDLGAVVQLDLLGQHRVQTRTLWAHHDFVELPDNDLAWLGYDFQAGFLIDDKGVDTAVDVLDRGPSGAVDSSQTDTLWNMFDEADWPYPIYVTNTRFLPGWMEFSHGNSLVYLEEQDSYLIMLRWIDTLVKVDGAGILQWALGGLNNEFTVVSGADPTSTGTDADLFQQSHFSDAWIDADGKLQILVFDNGLQPDQGNLDRTSRLVQYTVDETAKTIALDWAYPSDQYENLLGDVRRMGVEGCDHLLVSFSNQGRILELTRDGEIVWEVAAFSGAVTTRVTFLPDLYDFSGAGYP